MQPEIYKEKMKFFDIYVNKPNGERFLFDIHDHTKISDVLKDFIFCQVLLDGSLLNDADLFVDTPLSCEDELFIVQKDIREILDENMLVEWYDPDILKKYNKKEKIDIFVKKGQSIYEILTTLKIGLNFNDEQQIYGDNEFYTISKTIPYEIYDINVFKNFIIKKPYDDFIPTDLSEHVPILAEKIPFGELKDVSESDLFKHNAQKDCEIVIEEFGELSNLINRYISETGSIMAGSYVLKYLGLIEKVGDVDIFNYNLNFLTAMVNELDLMNLKYKLYLNNIGQCDSYKLYIDNCDLPLNFIHIKDYGNDLSSSIEELQEKILKFIISDFDISACITCYNGKTIFMNDKLMDKKIDCFLEGMRIIKYIKRGFIVRQVFGKKLNKLYADEKRTNQTNTENLFMGRPRSFKYKDYLNFDDYLIAVLANKEAIKYCGKYERRIRMSFCQEYFDN